MAKRLDVHSPTTVVEGPTGFRRPHVDTVNVQSTVIVVIISNLSSDTADVAKEQINTKLTSIRISIIDLPFPSF